VKTFARLLRRPIMPFDAICIMSQSNIEIRGTRNGIEIQRHLEKISEDMILETFGKGQDGIRN
jgi:hypothetical protein